MKHLLLVLLVLSVIVSCSVAQEDTEDIVCVQEQPIELGQDIYRVELEQDGTDRFYNLFVPDSYDPEQPMALVIAFHGATMTPATMAQLATWHELGEEEGFITAYPAGVRSVWNDGVQTDEAILAIDDVAFTEMVIDDISEKLCIDTERILAAGFSNGASMSGRLACEMSDRITVVGLVSGGHFPAENICESAQLMPIIGFFGTEDPVVPFEGGTSPILSSMGLPDFPSIEEGMLAWANFNGCDSDAVEDTITEAISRQEYSDCDDESNVTLYVIEGGGHAWPGSSTSVMGATTQDIDATMLVWEFFAMHAHE